MERIYLDNNATTRPDDAVLAAVDVAQRKWWANPSSVHRFGQKVRQQMELARCDVATLIGAAPRGIVFTSGGTEANNLALGGVLQGALRRAAESQGDPPTLITTAIEHAAVREPGETLGLAGVEVVNLPLHAGGVVDPADLAAVLKTRTGVVLVSVQWANNETGVIQPIEALAKGVHDARQEAAGAGRRPQIYLHTDATQAVGKIKVDVKAVGVDLLSLAAHKFHGPKGVGALYVGPGVPLAAVQRGGPQERERRGGTENVPAVLGLGVAAKLAAARVDDTAGIQAGRALRDRLEGHIAAACPKGVVNSGLVDRLWNTSNLGFRGLEAEALLLGLSERGVCASAGAACSSGSLEPSPVLRAMGIEEAVAHGSIRLSLSQETTQDQVDHAAEVLIAVVKRLGRVLPV
ncbi:MAG: cysteine desulfurase family protein [Algisphaera sp.]